MSQNGQTHFKTLAANAARFLKCVWPFWDIMHERVKFYAFLFIRLISKACRFERKSFVINLDDFIEWSYKHNIAIVLRIGLE